MAVDKLVDSAQLDADLTAVANAIRNKTGQTGELSFPTGMAQAIAAIPTSGGGRIGSASVTVGSNATTITINNLLGQPLWFIFQPTINVPQSGTTRRVTSHVYNGTSDVGFAVYSSGSWGGTVNVNRDTTNFSHTYANRALTLKSNSGTTGGYYHQGEWSLYYGY